MKNKIICFSVCMLLLVTYAGAVTTPDVKVITSNKSRSNFDYSHGILGEFFTLTTCVPCKYTHRALKALYKGEYHPFEYLTLVYDEEEFGGSLWAKQRHGELQIEASPTVCWDGPWKKDKGSNEDVEEDMADFNVSLIAAGNRNVKDIDINLDVEWLGAVNNVPADGATLVPIEQKMSWTNSEMEIDVEVINNETSEYNGHLHVYVTEVNSTLWNDKWGDPYTFALLDYAWNEDVTISASSSWDDTVNWDGYDHHTGYEVYFENITQDNIMVTASVFDNDNNKYADETTGMRTGFDTDPKLFDVYFGETNPPPLVADNKSTMIWFPHDPLNWSTTYYWKVDTRDQHGVVTEGEIWSFTTRGNDPPNDPNFEFPTNESTGESIEVNLSWACTDPDGDDLTFDVWFGDAELGVVQVSWNQTEKYYLVQDLDFLKKYYWQIVAWEVDYNLTTTGPTWNFETEANVPPNPAEEPHPFDGDKAVPKSGVTLEWNGSDNNFGDTLRYDLYFDDVNPPLTQQVWESYDDWWEIEFELDEYEDYYWQVDTYDREGEFTEGNVWTFYTGDNNPPTDPTIDGPTKGGINVLYHFTFMSIDPEGHSIKYHVKWGDGKENFTSFYPSGTTVELSHVWKKDKTYTIQAWAIDEYGATSNMSTHTIVIPRNKVFIFKLLDLLFTRFPNAFPMIQQFLGL